MFENNDFQQRLRETNRGSRQNTLDGHSWKRKTTLASSFHVLVGPLLYGLEEEPRILNNKSR